LIGRAPSIYLFNECLHGKGVNKTRATGVSILQSVRQRIVRFLDITVNPVQPHRPDAPTIPKASKPGTGKKGKLPVAIRDERESQQAHILPQIEISCHTPHEARKIICDEHRRKSQFPATGNDKTQERRLALTSAVAHRHAATLGLGLQMRRMIGLFSKGIARIPHLTSFLGESVTLACWGRMDKKADKIAGWGQRPSAARAQRFADKHQLPYLAIEDGFLRSFGLGVEGVPPLSLVIDDQGIYYDATRPSRLETILNEAHFSAAELDDAARILSTLRELGLSKYNVGGAPPPGTFTGNQTRILVVDQTLGDASVSLGLAEPNTFAEMLASALEENPGAAIYVKSHPDVLAGKKAGHLSPEHFTDPRIHWIFEHWHPFSLLPNFDRIYVATSQMGLDALILGKQVSCFGLPFYSGWGLSDDRKTSPRRTRRRSLVELIAACYLRYARYIQPETGLPGSFFDVARFISRQKQISLDTPQRIFCIGFRYWKHAHVRPFFGGNAQVHFAGSVRKALRKRQPAPGDAIVVWGQKNQSEDIELAHKLGIPLIRMEDGFVRSIGLGADFVPPYSLVLDRRGIYFDPSAESDLEHLLNHSDFSEELLLRAEQIGRIIREHRITKYNVDQIQPLSLQTQDKKVILVPGQVEDDASVLKGAHSVRSNEQLLQAVRNSNPDAFIIYKPHPDVLAGNRRGHMQRHRAAQLCDHMELQSSVLSCLETADEVHTITSLTGFEALLRDKPVHTYGSPFYAGWGLTTDAVSIARRRRKLNLAQLIAGTLILYPRYWNPECQGFVEIENVLEKIAAELEHNKNTGRLPYPLRQMKKWRLFLKGILDASTSG